MVFAWSAGSILRASSGPSRSRAGHGDPWWPQRWPRVLFSNGHLIQSAEAEGGGGGGVDELPLPGAWAPGCSKCSPRARQEFGPLVARKARRRLAKSLDP
eukprot:gene11298-biopygen1303